MAFSVLIVDDSAVMRSFIRRVMEISGFPFQECLEASDGAEAMALLGDHWVDVILTDINMPVMNGEQFLAAIRDDGTLGRVPVVVISTWVETPASPCEVMLRVAVARLDEASVTATVKLEVPAAVGVPEITPAVERVRPEGSVPADRDHV